MVRILALIRLMVEAHNSKGLTLSHHQKDLRSSSSFALHYVQQVGYTSL